MNEYFLQGFLGKLLGLVVLPGLVIAGIFLGDKAGEDDTVKIIIILALLIVSFFITKKANSFQKDNNIKLFRGLPDFLLSISWIVPLIIGLINANSDAPDMWAPILIIASVLVFLLEPLWFKLDEKVPVLLSFFWRAFVGILSLSIILFALFTLFGDKEEDKKKSFKEQMTALAITAAIGWFLYRHFFGKFGILHLKREQLSQILGTELLF